MTALPPAPEFPTYRLKSFLPLFLLGWAAGVLLTLLVRAAGGALLSDPCEGRTLLALAVPLLLGPGGLAFTAASWRHPPRAALGLGLVVASLLPALYLGALDIGKLRGSGCAGGYVILAPAGGEQSVSSVSIPAGGTLNLTGRIGGFRPQNNPGVFTLRGQGAPGLTVQLPPQAQVGEVFPVIIQVSSQAGVNTYTLGVLAQAEHRGQMVSAAANLEVNVRPRNLP